MCHLYGTISGAISTFLRGNSMFVIIVLVVLLFVGLVLWTGYNALHPVQNCSIIPHFIQTRRRLYIIAQFGLRWIVEIAESEHGNKLPLDEGEKMRCTVLEGAPAHSGIKLSDDEIRYMQCKLCEHLDEYYPWILVTEVIMAQRS